MKKLNHQIFDILGIGAREDSYTDLICYYFNNNSTFRNNLIEILKGSYAEDWKAKTRIPIKPKAFKKIVPDLILWSKKQDQLIIIEVKVFSSEGKDQTELYSGEQYVEALKKILQINNAIPFYYYLTLSKEKARGAKFINIDFKIILQALPTMVDPVSKLDVLAEELRFRLKEYYEFSPPKEEDRVLDYLESTERLVSASRCFELLVDAIIERQNHYRYIPGTSNNAGDGLTHHLYWYKDNWVGKKIRDAQTGGNCLQIHFEFHWHTNNPRNPLAIYIHYHTNPYLTKKAAKKHVAQNPESRPLFEEYESRRSKFFHFLKSSCPQSNWTFKNTYLRIAQFEFDSEITKGQIQTTIQELTSQVEHSIDEFNNGHNIL